MAYIPGFKHDIFISYAHIDNIPILDQQEGWVNTLYKNLKVMLDKRIGKMNLLDIWYDNKALDGSTLFDNSIENGIMDSAIMICINSPGYKESDYCKKEMVTFHKKALNEKTGIMVGDRSRMVQVLLNNIPHAEWPEELSGATGFPFHNATDADSWGDTLEPDSDEFKKTLQNLRDAIFKLITDFIQEQSKVRVEEKSVIKSVPEKVVDNNPTGASDEGDNNGYTVFMGEVSDSLRVSRKRAILELEKKGFKVKCGIPPPDDSAGHEAATLNALNSSQIAIHLLDTLPGREIVDCAEMGYPQKQTEIVLNSDKAQMIWMPADIDFEEIEDEAYKKFLRDIEERKPDSKNYEFIKGSKSTLAMEIIDFVERLKEEQTRAKPVKGKISVLLDTHLTDQLYAFELGKALVENQIQPYINPQEDNPRDNLNLLEDRIKQVTKLVFVYGGVSKDWLLERMSAAVQLIITKNYPIDGFYVYMAPPIKPKNDILMNQRFLKVVATDNLQQLLTGIKTDGVC